MALTISRTSGNCSRTIAALLGEVTGLARLWAKSRWGGYRARVAEATAPMLVDQPMASCFLIRRPALAQVGLMDERFPIFFNDVDLCYRLREAGWEIWYLPEVRVLHHGGAATRQVRPAMIRESHRSLHHFYEKHYRRRLPAPLYAAIVGAIYLSSALRVALHAPCSVLRVKAGPPNTEPGARSPEQEQSDHGAGDSD